MISRDAFEREFQQRFGHSPEVIARAPGRVNLIGEHTDYNEGFVLPVAIDREIWVGVSARKDRVISAFSTAHGERVHRPLSSSKLAEGPVWINYPVAIAQQLLREGWALSGCNLMVAGDIPVGAGLASSAAFLVAVLAAWEETFGIDLTRIDAIQLARRAENEYVGVACGIMDPFIAFSGKKGHALLVDCRNLVSRHVAVPSGLSIMVCDTGVRRELARSEYNVRRGECEEGVQLLGAILGPIQSLRDVTWEQMQECAGRLPEKIMRRCRHVVSENARVLLALEALSSKEVEALGDLMRRSHESLRDDYEVSCAELDAMVELARQQEGVVGARMTGAGFGGCTVNLVKKDLAETATAAILEAYNAKFPHNGTAYICRPSAGASILKGTGGQA